MRKPGECELCGRHTDLSFHHLIPRKMHRRAHFKKHYSKEQLQAGVLLCRLCHRGIHRLYDEMTLAKQFQDLASLRSDAAIAKHVAWVHKQRSGLASDRCIPRATAIEWMLIAAIGPGGTQKDSPRMTKRVIIMLVVLTVIFGGVYAFILGKEYMIGQYLADYKPPPIQVEYQPAELSHWDRRLETVGNVLAANGVDVSSEVSGLVREIYFASGQEIEAGAPLVQLEDSVEQASLRSYEAQLKLAKINYDREVRLSESRAISKTDLDKSSARLEEMQAQVERTKALIEQKQIKAPFNGRLGLREVNVGEFISTGDSVVSLQALDDLFVDFTVPERYAGVLKPGLAISFQIEALGDKDYSARLSSINVKVNEANRALSARAQVEANDGLLLPGMFARVRIVLEEKVPVVTLPDTAISYNLFGDSVFVVSEELADEPGIATVERRYVRLGERQGDRVEVLEGVKAGDLVVTVGQLKLDNGSRIVWNSEP